MNVAWGVWEAACGIYIAINYAQLMHLTHGF